MKYRLPKLSREHSALAHRWFALVLFALTSSLAAQDASPLVSISGQQLVAQAATQLHEAPSLEAKVRQRVDMFGQRFTGTGHYVQLHHQTGNHFRLDLRLQVGDRSSSFQHHNDGVYLWVRRNADGVQSLSRIELARVQAAMKKTSSPPSAATSPGIGIGGLSQLLHGLNTHFKFDEPTASKISGVPVWQLAATWKRESLALLLPDQTDAIESGEPADFQQLSPQIPTHVELVLGRDEQVPLFPYRVSYSRHDAKSGKARPMLTMELFEVRLRPDLDARQFRFPLEDEQRVEDETDAYLQKMGISSQPE